MICLHDITLPFFLKLVHVQVGKLHIVSLYMTPPEMALSTLNSYLSLDTLIIFLIFIVSCKDFAVCNLFQNFLVVLVD